MLLNFEKSLSEIAPTFLRKKEFDDYCFPIECDDGWFLILKKYLAEIEELNNSTEFKIIADQIKEKFGILNIYFHIEGENINDGVFEKVNHIIEQAEEESWKTCEHCGKPATRTTSGWIKRLCDNCFKEKL